MGSSGFSKVLIMGNGTEGLIEGINRSWMHFKSPKIVYPMQIYDHFCEAKFFCRRFSFYSANHSVFRHDTTFEFYSARIYQFCATPFKDFIIQFRLMVNYFHYFRNLEFFTNFSPKKLFQAVCATLCYLLVKTVKHGVGKSIS